MAAKRIPTEIEIAKKHGVSIKYVTRQSEIGSTVEREHATDHKTAYGIALQHISEFPNYYKHLLSMEKQLKRQWGNGKNSVKECKTYKQFIEEAREVSFNINSRRPKKIATMTKSDAERHSPEAEKLHKKARNQVDLPKYESK